MLIWGLEYWLDTAEEAQNLAFFSGRMSDMCTSGVYPVPEVLCFSVHTFQSCISIAKQRFFPKTVT